MREHLGGIIVGTFLTQAGRCPHMLTAVEIRNAKPWGKAYELF
jgi:hypothetical protein